MASPNVELVRAVYRLYDETGDVEASLGRYAPDVVWDMSDRVFNPRVYRGHEGIREWDRELREIWDEWTNEPERFAEAGDQVVAIVRSVAKGQGSGIELTSRWAQLWTVCDGKIVAMRHYRDPEAALAEIGLRD